MAVVSLFVAAAAAGTGSGADAGNAMAYATWLGVASTHSPGSTVLFKRGDTFAGSPVFVPGSSGSLNTYGAYGSGASPRLGALSAPLTFGSPVNGVYSCAFTDNPTTGLNCVSLDDALVPMGRYPRNSWLTYESHSGVTSITDTSLAGSPSWTNAEVAVRMYRYQIDRWKVTSHSGNTLTLGTTNSGAGGHGDTFVDGNGYFFQNHPRTLDTSFQTPVLGDWYYDQAGTLYMYFGASAPSSHTVRASTSQFGTTMVSLSYCVFNDIVFQGGDIWGIYAPGASNLTFNNCGMRNVGAIAFEFTAGSAINFNTFTLDQAGGSGGVISSSDCTLLNFTAKNIYLHKGMGNNGDSTGTALFIKGDNNTVRYADIQDVGYIGIEFGGANFLLEYFYIARYCASKDDGGGVYTFQDTAANKRVRYGVIVDGQSQIDGGAGDGGTGKAMGVYFDDLTANVTCTGVFVGNCGGPGFYSGNGSSNTVTGCTFYNNEVQSAVIEDPASGKFATLQTHTNNAYISKDTAQNTGLFQGYKSVANLSQFFTALDNNVYSRPLADGAHIYTATPATGTVMRTLAGWKTYSGLDSNSTGTPSGLAVASAADFRYDINPTNAPVVVTIPGTWKDAAGTSYTGSYSLPAWTGRALLRAVTAARPRVYVTPGGKALVSGGKVLVSDAVSSVTTDYVDATYFAEDYVA